MLKRFSIYAALILALSVAASAQTRKDRILIYNISIAYEKSIFIDTRRKAATEEFGHFSFIIPHTIAQNLNSSGRVEARKIDGELPIKDMGSDAFYDDMERLGNRYGAQYIIGGRATVRGRKLSLELALINVKTRDFIAIIKDSFETGAELKSIINEISVNIEQKLGVYRAETAGRRRGGERREGRVETGPSPFLKVYRGALDRVGFGVQTGRFFIKGPFSRIYADSEYYSPYLSCDILKWFGLTAQADYLKADNENIIVKQRSTMMLWAVTLNADFTYMFFEHFGVKLTAGFGASMGRIVMGTGDNPFLGIVSARKSNDPYLNLAASLNLRFKPLEINAGGGYKSAFFKGKSLSLITVFFGVGFHL
ncbi:MAG: hypothetical protein KA369_09880 [Spirochaetes bacterium]|nr:hypothetical protein [Spirochaetota bacterium]